MLNQLCFCAKIVILAAAQRASVVEAHAALTVSLEVLVFEDDLTVVAAKLQFAEEIQKLPVRASRDD